jgi:hypothetical protein
MKRYGSSSMNVTVGLFPKRQTSTGAFPFMQRLTLHQVRLEDRCLSLGKLLFLDVLPDQDCWTYQCSDLDIVGCVEDRSSVLSEFARDFFFLWDDFANEADSNLSRDGLELKSRMREVVAGTCD